MRSIATYILSPSFKKTQPYLVIYMYVNDDVVKGSKKVGIPTFFEPFTISRVTVVVLSVRLSVCAHSILGLQATRRFMSDTNSFSATRERKLMWRFC